MPVGREIPAGWGPRPSLSQAQVATAAEAEVLAALRAAGGSSTVAELAEALGSHRNTLREHLASLTARGAVERQRVSGGARGRPAYRYVLPDPAESALVTLLGILAAQVVLSSPDPIGEAIELGRTWGRHLVGDADRDAEPADVDRRRRLVEILTRLRFEVHADDGLREVRLTECPLVAIAREHPQVACGIHLGLIQAVVAGPGPATEPSLDAFAEPGVCLVKLP